MFGILKRGRKVCTQIIDTTGTDTLLPIIRSKIEPASMVYTESYRSYNALEISEFKHCRINHSELFADRHNHNQWYRKLLEPGQTRLTKVQRHSGQILLSVPQRV